MNYEPIPFHDLDIFPTQSRAAEEPLRSADQSAPVSVIEATPFRWQIPEGLPRRKWLYGSHYVGGFVSTTVSPGGIGKSALGIVEALSIASGRALLGIQPDERTNVWIWNGEDPLDEMQRRITAACMHYCISEDEVAERLFVDSGREMEIVIAVQSGRSGAEVNVPAVDQIISTVQRNGIGLLIVDPFVSSHRVSENDNGAIDLVVKTWAKIAQATGCAVELVHHSRKTGGASVTVEDARGAVALLGAARSARVLNSMTPEEAEKADVANRRLYFRVENGKANLVAAADRATWHKFASVDLGNAEEGHPGDSVGVVTQWQWPDALEGVSTADLRSAQTAVAAGGPWRENSQSKDWVGIPIAKSMGLDPANKAHSRKVAGLLKVWMKNGMFVTVSGKDNKRMERTFVEVGQWATD